MFKHEVRILLRRQLEAELWGWELWVVQPAPAEPEWKWERSVAPSVFCSPDHPESVSVLCFHRPNVILPQASLSGEDTCPTRAINTCPRVLTSFCPGFWCSGFPTPALESLIIISCVHVITALLSWHPWSRGMAAPCHPPSLFLCPCSPVLQSTFIQVIQLGITSSGYNALFASRSNITSSTNKAWIK